MNLSSDFRLFTVLANVTAVNICAAKWSPLASLASLGCPLLVYWAVMVGTRYMPVCKSSLHRVAQGRRNGPPMPGVG